jgi:hypothetical protein
VPRWARLADGESEISCTRKRRRKIDTNCTNSHEFRSTSNFSAPAGFNDLLSSEPRVFRTRKASPEKISIQVITLTALSRLTAIETKQSKRKEKP